MYRLITLYLFLALFSNAFAQQTVALDNWFNHEINSKTGKVYHYTWDDTSNSGFSQFGQLFKHRGAILKTVASKPNKKSLRGVDIYIIVDPDTKKENPSPNYIESDDIKFIKKWVKKGGVLLLMANDGQNCEFTHMNKLAEVFGFYFKPVTLNRVENHDLEMAAETNFSGNELFNGVSKIYMKEVAPIILSKNATVLVTNENSESLIAETNFGKGYVLAVGDPWLYNEYIDHKILPESFENLKAANNLVDLLLKKTSK